MINTRAVSLEVLMEILEQGSFSHVALREALERYDLAEKRDRAFVTRLTEGTVEHLYELDDIIDRFSKTKVKKMKPVIRTILRMSVYQMKYMDSVPDRAVCSEAVKLCEKRGFGALKGFVNGVLRTISREWRQIPLPDRDDDFLQYARIVYSMPEWIVSRLLAAYGKDRTEMILKGGISERPLTVRINQSLTNQQEIIKKLESQGVLWEPAEGMEEALVLKQYDHLESVEAFSRGLLQVQDVSSMLVGRAASPKEGDFVLDVCAAPGGKSLHAADLLSGTGQVEARDVSKEKTALIEENLKRVPFSNVSVKVWDALVLDETMVEKADIVLADLPCSGMGIIGRKSDIKYKMTEEGQKELAELQRRILDVVWRYVKPGGRLVFSTCTVFPSENMENALWFAKKYPFEPESLEEVIPERFFTETTSAGMLQLLPGEKGTDGFFIARFIRKAGT